MYQVYVLKSRVDNYHYIGHTKDISSRLIQHNYGKVRSTKAHKPYSVIYTEDYSTKSKAQQREYYLKRGEGNIWLRNYLKELEL
ncbi:GIY-YIG nuclease family protein [bacterium]|nr:GIY-YIG nuclease family protein [bacterium]MBU1064897.1 GIY-YIG nuclease family protein [bacterium]MBU1634317.1 GIY-YIG nuclease family protein [bacterium]MBU1874581.1 GIY-YIG nuclease family protein [bacterium]